jgi:hypothetical protein
MYFDAELGAPLLEPLLRYQSSDNYTQEFAGLDAGEGYYFGLLCISSRTCLGTSYPNTSFANSVHPQGVERKPHSPGKSALFVHR